MQRSVSGKGESKQKTRCCVGAGCCLVSKNLCVGSQWVTPVIMPDTSGCSLFPWKAHSLTDLRPEQRALDLTCLSKGLDYMSSRGAFQPESLHDIIDDDTLRALVFCAFLRLPHVVFVWKFTDWSLFPTGEGQWRASSQPQLWGQHFSLIMGAEVTKSLWTPELEQQILKTEEKNQKWDKMEISCFFKKILCSLLHPACWSFIQGFSLSLVACFPKLPRLLSD